MNPRTFRRITGGLIAGALAASLIACSSDGEEEATPTDSSSGSSGGSEIPTWPKSVDVVNLPASEVRDLTEKRAQAVSTGDCEVMVDDLTQSLQRISYQAGNEWREVDADWEPNDWSAISVTPKAIDGPAPTDTVCQYDINGMDINGVPGQFAPGDISRVTIGALPTDQNTFEVDEEAQEADHVTLEDISYAPIAVAGAKIVEDVVGPDGDYAASTHEGTAWKNSVRGTYLGAEAPGTQFRMLTTSLDGYRNGPATSGWWIKVDGSSEPRTDTEVDVTIETVNRLNLGLLAPAPDVIHKTEKDSLA